MGTLAQDAPARGLPRGRGSLPPAEVASRQRERLLRAITAAVAAQGYSNVSIADVVERARVSRASFYAQFASKEECFLAAHTEGMALILTRLSASAAADGDAGLRAALRAYLELAGAEPEFARCMLVELPAIGPAGLEARRAAHAAIAGLLRAWHEGSRARAEWPAIPATRYAAAVGAVHDLLFDAVARNDAGEPSALLDPAYDAVSVLLGLPG